MSLFPEDPKGRKRTSFELDPEVEEMLLAKAAARNLSPDDYVAKLIRHDLAVAGEEGAILKLRRRNT